MVSRGTAAFSLRRLSAALSPADIAAAKPRLTGHTQGAGKVAACSWLRSGKSRIAAHALAREALWRRSNDARVFRPLGHTRLEPRSIAPARGSF
jgi:hypothetical protein